MKKLSLDALARLHLERAKLSSAGRSSETIFGGHDRTLRQTVIALLAGYGLGEHPNPGEGTLQVVRGRVRMAMGEHTWEARDGDFLPLPEADHALEAITDAAVLLTVAKSR
ncbi:LuxR family transcriptional regulator [Lipingzhangella sp. LS1_29]|uniref:LuxR family transcriptional regulator n=1 Tax=Lipingzhangella rawalii TaxID=2055835 RepID=A0ABU2H7P1_9ACTN|nr:LuxR family transcriptional regulator [Lipingzhangella rawalii]MDS1271328.1 LuxR family transcriptional regulator [Lipingzhangella rawalii]